MNRRLGLRLDQLSTWMAVGTFSALGLIGWLAVRDLDEAPTSTFVARAAISAPPGEATAAAAMRDAAAERCGWITSESWCSAPATGALFTDCWVIVTGTVFPSEGACDANRIAASGPLRQRMRCPVSFARGEFCTLVGDFELASDREEL
jgi:hypothetical protein